MIFPSNRVRIVVATKPVDFRKGHDGLAALVKNELRKDPFTGTVFVFRSKRADRLKLLYWDGTGLVMTYKRLEETTFTWPAIRDGLMALTFVHRFRRRRARPAGFHRPELTHRSCPFRRSTADVSPPVALVSLMACPHRPRHLPRSEPWPIRWRGCAQILRG